METKIAKVIWILLIAMWVGSALLIISDKILGIYSILVVLTAIAGCCFAELNAIRKMTRMRLELSVLEEIEEE